MNEENPFLAGVYDSLGMDKSAWMGAVSNAARAVADAATIPAWLAAGGLGLAGYAGGKMLSDIRTPTDDDLRIMEERILTDAYRDKTRSLGEFKKKVKKRLGTNETRRIGPGSGQQQ